MPQRNYGLPSKADALGYTVSNYYAKTTNGETTIDNKYHGQISTGDTNAYQNANYNLKTTNIETMVNNKYLGQSNKNDNNGYQIANVNMIPTHKETTLTSYNGQVNAGDNNAYQIANVNMKTTNLESTLKSHTGQVNTGDNNAYQNANYDMKTTNAETTLKSYVGTASTYTQAENREQFNNADISIKKEQSLMGEHPSGPQKFNVNGGIGVLGEVKIDDNMLLKEQTNQRINNVNSISNIIPNTDIIGNYQSKIKDSEKDENTRFNGDLVKQQLKANPFYNLQ